MKPLFARNLSNTGRLVRGLGALALLIGAGFGFYRQQRMQELLGAKEDATVHPAGNP